MSESVQKNMSAVILRPLINEKSMNLVKGGFYTFEIGGNATKQQVEKVVKAKFSVDVISVKTINLPKKRKMQRSRKGYFSTSGMKKAIVQLKKGQKIALFESSQPEEEVEVKTAEGEPATKIKEKKSLLRGTKVTIGPADAVKIEKKGEEK